MFSYSNVSIVPPVRYGLTDGVFLELGLLIKALLERGEVGTKGAR